MALLRSALFRVLNMQLSRCVMVENTNSTILEVQASFGLTYMVGIIPSNLRSQKTNKGVPHARARRRRRRRPGRQTSVVWLC
jgi:hypothetical protein